MADTTPKPIKLSNTTSTTSDKGPFGGGTPYNIAKVGKDFVAIGEKIGHSQKANVKPVK